MKKHNRLFALLLAIAMVVTYMPAMAFADDESSWWLTTDSVDRYYFGNEELELDASKYLEWDTETKPEISYQWNQDIAEPDADDFEWSVIDGEIQSTITVSPEEAIYQCVLTEETTGSTESIVFYVYEDTKGWWLEKNSVDVKFSEADTNMQLNAGENIFIRDESVKLSYTWYWFTGENIESGADEDWAKLEETRDVLEVEAGYGYYKCDVADAADNHETIWFNLSSVDDEGDDDVDFGDLPDVNTIPEITLNKEEEVSVTEAEPVATFAFTAPKSGRYAFEAYGDEDTVGQVRTENEIIADDDDTIDYNFKVVFTAEEGVTYYLQATGYDQGALTFSVKVYDASWIAKANEEPLVYVGEPVMLSVAFDEEGEVPANVTYKWFDYNNDVISNSVSGQLAVSVAGTYYCDVSDGTTTQRVEFDVSLPSITQDKLSFYYYSYGVYVCQALDDESGNSLAVGDVTIPTTVIFADGIERSVDGIDEAGFKGATQMTSVTIPATVTEICECAFLNTGLKTITVPKTVETIGDYAIGYEESDAYDRSLVPGFVIKGYVNSEAQRYAEANGIDFEIIGSEDDQDEIKANEVSELINALPAGEDVTIADREDIEAARAAYNKLTDKQKALVSEATTTKLLEAEAALKDAEDAAAADEVVEMINALPENVTTADKDAIQAARAAYDALTKDQKNMIGGNTVTKLTEAEAALKDAEDAEAAASVIAQINALPTTVATSDKAAIEAARTAYDALTDNQKAKVSEEILDKLTAAEAALKEAEDQAAADAVVAKINELPAEVTTNDKAAIEEARTAYNALTADQKAKVSEEILGKLTAAEAALKEAEDQAAADAVIAKIDALPTTVTTADKAAIEAARAAYNALTDAQKEKVSAETLAKLTDAEAALKDAEVVEPVIEKINALPAKEDVTTANKAAIEAARKAYDALTDAQKAKVDAATLAKLTDAESALDAAIEAEDQAAADAVITKINALPAKDDVTTANKEAIKAARTAYDALTEAQKAKVDATTLAKLTDAETALKAAIDAEDEAAAEAVKNKIDALPTSVTTADRAAIEAAKAAFDALTDAQKAKVSEETRNKLTAAVTALEEAQREEDRRAEEARRAAQPKEIQDLPVVKITKPKAGKKKATVKWKKVTKKNLKKIQGIEIQVASDPGFNQIVKSTTAGKKKKSKTIKGLRPKTTYWVRIRAFRNAADGKHVSAWKVKKVKIKK